VAKFENSLFSAPGIDSGLDVNRFVRENLLDFMLFDFMCRDITFLMPTQANG